MQGIYNHKSGREDGFGGRIMRDKLIVPVTMLVTAIVSNVFKWALPFPPWVLFLLTVLVSCSISMTVCYATFDRRKKHD